MHPDQDDLALLAFGEAAHEVRAHVAVCAQCQAEVVSLSAVVSLARAAGPLDQPRPPAAVLTAIMSELEPTAAAPSPSVPRARLAAPSPSDTPSPSAPPVPLSAPTHARPAGPSRTVTWLLGAAAAGAALTWGTLSLLDTGDDAGTLVAQTTLESLDAQAGAGATAEIRERDGERVLVVQTDALPETADGYVEVWLLAPDVSGMVTVGLMSSNRAEFALPADLSLAAYPLVDVSLESFDGDPTHSGTSLWRGDIESG